MAHLPPFDTPELAFKVLTGEPQPLPPRYTEELRNAVSKLMLQKDPNARPTATELMRARSGSNRPLKAVLCGADDICVQHSALLSMRSAGARRRTKRRQLDLCELSTKKGRHQEAHRWSHGLTKVTGGAHDVAMNDEARSGGVRLSVARDAGRRQERAWPDEENTVVVVRPRASAAAVGNSGAGGIAPRMARRRARSRSVSRGGRQRDESASAVRGVRRV
eukprot:3695406-Prymnesium_polylepis.1